MTRSSLATKVAAHIDQMTKSPSVSHDEVLENILAALVKIADFVKKANIASASDLKAYHFVIIVIDEIVATAKKLQLGLAKQQGQVYTYNGVYWYPLEVEELEQFLGKSASKLGIDGRSKYHKFRAELRQQFMSAAYLPPPKRNDQIVMVNFLNGTLEINGKPVLRKHRPADFLTYVLPFHYDPKATAPKWQKFLDEVLPDADRNRQKVLAEYIGYCFTNHLKLEKVLLPYGGGSNGKSVFFDVIRAMFGDENISYYSLASLHHEYYRAKIAGKLLNYSSEISSKAESEDFKKMTSGEPLEARLPYGQPYTITRYAKLAFNVNELPSVPEHNHAFFRRFLIIPFDKTIEDKDQDKKLASKIVADELPGVLNWALAGLERLLKQGNFSECKAADDAVALYRKESDSVAMFAEEMYTRTDGTPSEREYLSAIYQDYREYCQQNGYKAMGRNKFAKRLERIGYERVDANQPQFAMRPRGEGLKKRSF